MAQLREPTNNYVEFVQVWGGPFYMYCEAVIMYDGRNGSKYMLRHISKDFATFFNKQGLKLNEQLQGLRFKLGSRYRMQK